MSHKPARILSILGLIVVSLAASGQTDERVAYAPDILGVGRLFLIALNVDPGAPRLEITIPDTVELLDQTPLPTDRPLRKYYLRALKAAEKTDIVFSHPDGPLTISLQIWDYDDLREFRELKGHTLPRRWPLGETLPALKQEQTITTELMKTRARERGGETRWAEVDDDIIWGMQPDSTIPRWHWVNVNAGCPTHGTEIFKHRAFYPWGKNSTPPWDWKITCPVENEKYPSNDFANFDFTSGPFPDDGIGGGCEHNGKRYGFIAETCQAYCHAALSVPGICADAYLSTGDIRHLHKCLVGLCRIAVEHAYLATMTHHRHRNNQNQVERLGQSLFSDGPFLRATGLTVYSIAQPGQQERLAEAYDAIWPDIDKDPQIIPFMQAKGYDINTHEDLRRFIEENLFAVWLQASMDGSTSSNQPRPQMGLVRLAEMLNYPRGNEFLDWLYDGGGGMRMFVTNTYFRDGAPYESTGHYNGTHLVALGPIIESVEHLRQMRPEVYPEDRYPNLTKSRRYQNVFDFSMDTVNIDRTFPRLGDCDGGYGYDAGFPQFRDTPRRTWQNGGAEAFEHAYKMFNHPKFAWALANAPDWQPSLGFPYTREQIEQAAAEWPDDFNDASCLRDGYGIAMLRSGAGINKRALWAKYGQARGHTHDDVMHIGLDAHGSEILGQMGYPRNWGAWEGNWMSHIQARSIPFVRLMGRSELFADAGAAHVCEVSARGTEDKVDDGEGYILQPDDWHRRMLAIVDVDDDEFYCVDLYRISGGEQHWWSFHCQEGDLTTEGLQLTARQGGTLAGPEVEWGDEAWLAANGCTRTNYGWRGNMFGFPFMYNIQRAATDARAREDGVWSADWALKNANGLHFRLTAAHSRGAEITIADNKSPAGGSPWEMKWILAHTTGDTPTRSQIGTVMELYRQQPTIRGVRPLAVSGEDEAGFEPYGIMVELANGRTDYIFASADPSVLRTAEGGFEFAGRFGLYSEENGIPVRLSLVGGTRLTRNGVGITDGVAEYHADIVAVDREAETITVSPAPADAQALVGKYIYINNSSRRVAYQVLSAETTEGGARLHLDFDSRIGTGKVTGHADHRVHTDTPFILQGYRYYDGARLVNADRTAEYRIIEVRSGQHAIIDPEVNPDAPAARLEAEFPAGTWFDVYDYGVGDEVLWPNTVSVSRINPHAYDVTATGTFAVSLPKG